MIHLGYEASALERRGIPTDRGDHNREVQKRNAERVIESAEKSQKYETEKIEQLEKELQKIPEIQKTTRYMEKLLETDKAPSYVSELEKQLKAEKAMQYIEKMQVQHDTAEKTAKRMNALKENYIVLEKEKIPLIEKHNKDKYELPPLEYRAEQMDEHAENIEALQNRLEQLQKNRRNLRLFDLKQKKDTDAQIAQATQSLERAQDFFKNHFHIDPTQAAEELKRLHEEIRAKKDELNTKQIIVQAIRKKQATIELTYHTQKLLNETRPNQQQITHLLEQMHQPPESTLDRLLQEQINRRLNIIPDEKFQKVIENLPPYQARILTTIREQAKERQRLIEAEKDRSRTFDRSR
jgi:hypothetical protein